MSDTPPTSISSTMPTIPVTAMCSVSVAHRITARHITASVAWPSGVSPSGAGSNMQTAKTATGASTLRMVAAARLVLCASVSVGAGLDDIRIDQRIRWEDR